MPRTAAASAAKATARNGSNGNGSGSDERAMRDVLAALESLADGDFSVRLSTRRTGLAGDVAKAFNRVAERNARFTKELGRVGKVVGREGRMGERVSLDGAGGAWATNANAVNGLIDDLARPTIEVARVLQAVAQGDLSQKITVAVKGEILELKNTINEMVDNLNTFASEVTRVAR